MIFLQKSGDLMTDKKSWWEYWWYSCDEVTSFPTLESYCRLSESIEKRPSLKLAASHLHRNNVSQQVLHLVGSVIISQCANNLSSVSVQLLPQTNDESYDAICEKQRAPKYSYHQSVTCWGRWCWLEDGPRDCTPWEDLEKKYQHQSTAWV